MVYLPCRKPAVTTLIRLCVSLVLGSLSVCGSVSACDRIWYDASRRAQSDADDGETSEYERRCLLAYEEFDRHRFLRAATLARDAAAVARTPGDEVGAHLSSAVALGSAGRGKDMIAAFEEVAVIAEREDRLLWRLQAANGTALGMMADGRFDEGMARLADAIEAVDADTLVPEERRFYEAMVYNKASRFANEHRDGEAAAEFRQNRALFASSSDGRIAEGALVHGAEVESRLGNADEARAYLTDLLTYADDHPLEPWTVSNLMTAAHVAGGMEDRRLYAAIHERLRATVRTFPDMTGQDEAYFAFHEAINENLNGDPFVGREKIWIAVEVMEHHFSEERARQLAEQEAGFDAERRDADIQALTDKDALSRQSIARQRVALLVISVLGFGFVAMACLVFHRRKRLARAESEAAALHATMAERSRMSREVHDTLMQSYAGAVLQAERAAKLVESDPSAARSILEAALDQSDGAMRDARLSILGGQEADVDLDEELHRLAARYAGGPTDIDVTVAPGRPRLPSGVRNVVLRVASEAIANAVHHAKARRLDVTIVPHQGGVRLSVSDDGAGFDPAAAVRNGHHGLANMRARAEEAGAAFEIQSAAGAGTRIVLTVPGTDDVRLAS